MKERITQKNTSKEVLTTLIRLLSLKSSTTVNEIADFCAKPRKETLRVLHVNKRLIKRKSLKKQEGKDIDIITGHRCESVYWERRFDEIVFDKYGGHPHLDNEEKKEIGKRISKEIKERKHFKECHENPS